MAICCQKDCHNDGDLRCSRCKKVNYCSKECQRSDWKQHKKQCKKPEKERSSSKNNDERNGKDPSSKTATTTISTPSELLKLYQNSPDMQNFA